MKPEIRLFLDVFIAGALSFGGLAAVLSSLQNSVVSHHHLISGENFSRTYSLAVGAPGPNAIFLSLLGYQVAGPMGACLACLAWALPTIFLRDCYDHCIQVVDLLETYREVASSLMDIYLSSISNKMNEVMKVLTIITTIFVPLTFVAGVYGMNFNTEKSPWNMPELNTYYGYPLCWMVMLTIAGAEIFYFWRKGWIFESKHTPPPPPAQHATGPSVSK